MRVAEHHDDADDTPTQRLPAAPAEPVGARAQQALLEQAFAEEAPGDEATAIDRAGLQGARDAAAQWSVRTGLPAGFWERLVRDASIFTIVFAALVLAILQAM